MIDIKQFSFYKRLEFDTSVKGVFRIYLKRFWPLFLISLFGQFILQFIIYKIGFYELLNFENQEEMMLSIGQFSNKFVLISVTYVILFGILNSFLISYILNKDIQSDLSFNDALFNSLKNNAIHMIFFMIISIILLIGAMSIGVFVFLIGLVFAGLYIGSVLFPGGTLLVVEDKNAIEALAGTFSLVHKDFWNNLGIFIVFLLALLVLTLGLNSIISVLFDFLYPEELIMDKGLAGVLKNSGPELSAWILISNSVLSALLYPLYATTSVIMYVKLRFQDDQKNKIE